MIAAALAAALFAAHGAGADTTGVGAMAEVQRTVYGAPPLGSQVVKRKGDSVVFQEEIETLDASGALIRFIDDSRLTLGAKSKVLIDSFVFDPGTVEGNALIRISVGTLRYVTGQMPKGGTIIKTPTATLTLRGTDVTVHVHPDGTTDAKVNEGDVDAHNDLTNTTSNLAPGDGATLGEGGNTDFNGGDGASNTDFDGDTGNTPEHRRGGSQPGPSGHSGDSSSGGGLGPDL